MDSKESDSLPFFLQKLWQIVCDQQTDHLISWSEDGKSFFVIQPEMFSHEVLPQYFKHRNFSSFVRQLNMYGFHKIVATENGLSSSGEEIGFTHPHFVQDKPEELDQIKRKVNPRNTQLVQQTNQISKDDLDTMVKSLHELKNRQDQVVSALSSLTRDKDGLWTEVLTLRQQVTRQDAVIKKLLGFIGQCVTQGSLPLKRPHLAITQMDEVEGPHYKVGSMSNTSMAHHQQQQAQQQPQFGSASSIGQASSLTSASPEDMYVRPSKVVLSDETENMDDLDYVLSPGTMSELLPGMSAAEQASFAAAATASATGTASMMSNTPSSLASDVGGTDSPCPPEVFGIHPPKEGLNPKCIKSCGSHIDHVGMGLDGVQKYLSSTLGTTTVDQLFDSNDVIGADLGDPFQSGVATDPFTGVPISSPPEIATATASNVQLP